MRLNEQSEIGGGVTSAIENKELSREAVDMFRRIIRRSLMEYYSAVSDINNASFGRSFYHPIANEESASIASFLIATIRKTSGERRLLVYAYLEELSTGDTITTTRSHLYGLDYLLHALDDENIARHTAT